jgi:hypothetical protein
MSVSEYAKGYQDALKDISAALDNAGADGVRTWLTANLLRTDRPTREERHPLVYGIAPPAGALPADAPTDPDRARAARAGFGTSGWPRRREYPRG